MDRLSRGNRGASGAMPDTCRSLDPVDRTMCALGPFLATRPGKDLGPFGQAP